mgnify:CR=1 FL=1
MPADDSAPRLTEGVHAYAIRRVNPFLGVLQIIETDGGRAVSANGVVWDIEVLAQRVGGAWGSLNSNNRDRAYYRYGLWSLADGLVSRPLAPHLDSDPLTRKCHELIHAIRDRVEQLPFELQDRRELWLFDAKDTQPLALLATAAPDTRPPSPEPRYWSACIGANGVPSQRRFPATRELEAQVKQRAGFNIHKHWVTRLDDGSGVIESADKQLTAHEFPAYLLSERWSDAEQAERVSDYIAWISPSLLTLQNLAPQQRQRLERSLNVQAVSVEHHWHLYPDIIDGKAVKAARVQCRLQTAADNHR